VGGNGRQMILKSWVPHPCAVAGWGFDLERDRSRPENSQACPNRFSVPNSYTQLARHGFARNLRVGPSQRPHNSSALLQIGISRPSGRTIFISAGSSSVAGSMATWQVITSPV